MTDGLRCSCSIPQPTSQIRVHFNARLLFLTLVGLLLTMAGCTERRGDGEEIVVFAAASLTDVVEALADTFELAHPGVDIVINVAGTSLLARQLQQGARADVFLSANAEWMNYLADRNRLVTNERLTIRNELVVASRTGQFESVEQLTEAGRIALADPEHVPAGIYAREALQCLGLWDQVKDRIVPTLDVRAAVQALIHGGAPAAIVYRTDLLAMPEIQHYSVIEETCQPDIQYRVGRLVDAPNPVGAQEFAQFLLAPQTRAIWTRFGFRFLLTDRPS